MLDTQLALALFPKPLKQLSNFYQPLYPKAVAVVMQFIEQCQQAPESCAAVRASTGSDDWSDEHSQDASMMPVSPVVTPALQRGVYIAGERGVGKTHLTQAACEALNQAGVYALYLPLKTLIHQSPSVLEGARSAQCVCIDDIDVLAHAPVEWRIEMFALLNHAIEHKHFWLCSSRAPLTELDTGLADLNSRLCLSAQAVLDAVLDDELCAAFVTWLCEQRRIHITETLVNYICQRVPRDIGLIVGIIYRLDSVLWENRKTLHYKFLSDFLEKTLSEQRIQS